MNVVLRLLAKWHSYEIEKFSYMPRSTNIVSKIDCSKWGRVALELTCKKMPRLKGVIVPELGPFQTYLNIRKIRSLDAAEIIDGFNGDDSWLLFSNKFPREKKNEIESEYAEYNDEEILMEEPFYPTDDKSCGTYLGGVIEIIDPDEESQVEKLICSPDGIFKPYARCWEITQKDAQESLCIAKALYAKGDKQIEVSFEFNTYTIFLFMANNSKPQLNTMQPIFIFDKNNYTTNANSSNPLSNLAGCMIYDLCNNTTEFLGDGISSSITERNAKANVLFDGDFESDDKRLIESHIELCNYETGQHLLADGPLRHYKLISSWIVVEGFDVEESSHYS